MKLDSNTTTFVFPGQGSQAVGMGRDLASAYPAARATFDEADHILHFPISRLMWDGPESELNDTINTQPALFVHSIAAFRVLSHLHPGWQPAALAGHSLGELSALAAAGALSFEAGLRLVRKRGELMKKAGEMNPGSMAAILNLDIPALEKVCAQASRGAETVQVANDNCPGQVVISGAKAAVERAMTGAKAAGAKRAIPLAVSIAAHSNLMATIQAEWNEAVKSAAIGDAPIQVIGNVAAKPLRSAGDLCIDIQLQMQSRVRWTESIQLLAGQGITTFVEVGPGSVLLGLIKRIAPSALGQALGNPQDFESLSV
ncbi:MAG TPA: ACP S-malonyltransferase [Anaerolineales bacterium]|nr:ACP S-malonyltransferase [Anaerolineales bacterium]